MTKELQTYNEVIDQNKNLTKEQRVYWKERFEYCEGLDTKSIEYLAEMGLIFNELTTDLFLSLGETIRKMGDTDMLKQWNDTAEKLVKKQDQSVMQLVQQLQAV